MANLACAGTIGSVEKLIAMLPKAVHFVIVMIITSTKISDIPSLIAVLLHVPFPSDSFERYAVVNDINLRPSRRLLRLSLSMHALTFPRRPHLTPIHLLPPY